MAVSIADLGSLVVDVDDNVLDGYWIDDEGATRDHFRIVKGVGQVPALSPWGLLCTGVALLACAPGTWVRQESLWVMSPAAPSVLHLLLC